MKPRGCSFPETASDSWISRAEILNFSASLSESQLARVSCYLAGMSRVSPLGVIPPQLPSLTDQPPGRSDWIHKIKHYRAMFVLEAQLTVRDIRVLVALIADVLKTFFYLRRCTHSVFYA